MARMITKALASANSIQAYRSATAKDLKVLTRRAVAENWHIGPDNFYPAYQFDPKGFFVGEVNGEVASHIAVIRYPNHSSFLSAIIVENQFRRKGIATEDMSLSLDACDKTRTIGGDFGDAMSPLGKRLGFKHEWNSYYAVLSSEKVVKRLRKIIFPSSIAVKSIRDVKMERVLEYDQQVFGTARHLFTETWIKGPGNFGWVAVNANHDTILGYAVVKHVIRGGGTEIGLAMAPLFADDSLIAMYLLKTAAEYCLSNEALPNTKLQLFHPVGDGCGEDAPQLMNELEAELTHVGYRLYTKGVPLGRQTRKIYGITSLSFD